MAEDRHTDTTLRLLSEIEQNELGSQRSFSSRLGIAVGLTNAYIKRCLTKGWIKMSRAPARRYAYYLTPKGFAEKSRLTAEYLAASFQFFREARAQCLEAFRYCERRHWRRVVLYGSGELAEIAALAARESFVDLIAVIAPQSAMEKFGGLPVRTSMVSEEEFDAVLITDIRSPQAVFDELRKRYPEDRILTPALLHVSRAAIPLETARDALEEVAP